MPTIEHRMHVLGSWEEEPEWRMAEQANPNPQSAELIEALRDTLSMLKAAHIQLGMQHDINKRVVKARAALAKAEGRT